MRSNDKEKICDIINPIFVENIVRGIKCQHDHGWIKKEYQNMLRSQMENIAKICNIVPESSAFGTYKKETR